MKIVKNSNTVCFNCLKHSNVYVLKIHELGEGSFYNGFNTELHLCNYCLNEELKKWFELEVIGNDTKKKYLYEDELLAYVNKMPLAGQELFYNRYAYGKNVIYTPTKKWLEHLSSQNNMSSVEVEYTGDSYASKYSNCEEVYNLLMPDGSIYSKCPFGLTGLGNAQEDYHNENISCYSCAHYRKRNSQIRNILYENDEEYANLRLKELMEIARRRQSDNDYKNKPLCFTQVNELEVKPYKAGTREYSAKHQMLHHPSEVVSNESSIVSLKKEVDYHESK